MLSNIACEGKSPATSQKEEAKAREQSLARLKERIIQVSREFQEVYSADATWTEAFTRRPVWTIDVQARLIPRGSIIGTGYVDDVELEDGQYLIHFRRGLLEDVSTNFRPGGISVSFKLRCDVFNDHRPESKRIADQVNSEHSGGLHDTHVFVAEIDSVARTYKPIARDNDAELLQSRHFTATGKCLAIRYVDE